MDGGRTYLKNSQRYLVIQSKIIENIDDYLKVDMLLES